MRIIASCLRNSAQRTHAIRAPPAFGEISCLAERVERLEEGRLLDRERIESLEADIRARDHRYRTLLAYTRELLAWVRRSMHDHRPPAPLAALAEDLV